MSSAQFSFSTFSVAGLEGIIHSCSRQAVRDAVKMQSRSGKVDGQIDKFRVSSGRQINVIKEAIRVYLLKNIQHKVLSVSY